MWKILLEEFVGDLRGQKTRVGLTMLAVIWGTAAVVLLLAFGEGLKRSVSTGLLNAGEKIFMVWGGETSSEFEGLPKGREISLTENDLELLRRSIPEIDMASPSYGHWVTLEHGKVRTTTFSEGVWPSFSDMRHMWPQAGGRFIDRRDVDEKRRVLFLGDEIAKRLFGDEDPIGKTVKLDGTPFTVIGVMESKFQDSSNNGRDADRAIIPASTAVAKYGDRHVNHLLIRPRSVPDAPFVKSELYRVLGSRYKFSADDDRALSIWDFFEDEKQTRAVGLGIQIFLGLVGTFTLIVAGVGVANIMYVVVRERTREIGIKLAVGARKRHVMAQFVFEALALCLVGGVVGMLGSAAVVYGVDRIPTSNPAMQYLANPALSWPITLVCVGILVAIGLVSGFLPARRAASLDPVESLRYE